MFKRLVILEITDKIHTVTSSQNMFSKKKNPPRKSGDGKGQELMKQMGLFPDMMGGGLGNDDDDDLEAELLALQGGGAPKKKSKPSKNVDINELDRIVAASMQDIPSDEELSDGEDADLLTELNNLVSEETEESILNCHSSSDQSPVHSLSPQNTTSFLEQRLDMYKQAEANAKSAGDSSKARRMNRGVKTLHDLMKSARSGKVVAEDDIPPAVSVASSKLQSKQYMPEEEQIPQPSALWSPGQPPLPVPETQPALHNTLQSSITIPRVKPPVQPRQPPSMQPREPQAIHLSAQSVSQWTPIQPLPGGVPEFDLSAIKTTKVLSDDTSQQYFEPTSFTCNLPHVYTHSQPHVDGPSSSSAQLPGSDVLLTRASFTAPDAEKHILLTVRRDQYKKAALEAKRSADNATAMSYIKISKQFDNVLVALERGDPIDLSKMPPPPPDSAPASKTLSHMASQTARSSMQASASTQSLSDVMDETQLSSQERKKLFNAPESASSPLEALEQRLAKYNTSEDEAKTEGNGSKARRMGRIVKQYQTAIKDHKAGKIVDFDELPCPPGFPPITSSKTITAVGTPTAVPVTHPPVAQPAIQPEREMRHMASGPPPVTQKPKIQRQMSSLSRAEQQTLFLQERQLQYKKAALAAKQNGDMELAKKYLRFSKGFDPMIEASTAGLPVNISQIPPALRGEEEEKGFVIVEEGDVLGDRDEMYKKLEQEIVQQIRTCTANADNFTHLGDVSSANKFDRAGQNCRKDLDALRNAFKLGDPVPRFHYENRQFSIVKSCADLGENDLDIVILRGLNYNLPSGYQAKDLDTYVKFEFPFPSEDPQVGQTDTNKQTDSPEYNQSFKLKINRKSRVFQRLLKSNKTVKFEIFYKRGFLKSDKLLGTVGIKLHALENSCEIHESADLMDGRKACGGRLEFKIRIRDPMVSKQVEDIKEKWLVIDHFNMTSSLSKPNVQQKAVSSKPAVPHLPKSPPYLPNDWTSMEVLKFEKQQLDIQIRRYQGKLTKSEEDSLYHKGQLLLRQIEDTKAWLQKGGSAAWKAYADGIEKSEISYNQEAKALVQQGNRDKATLFLQKKKLVEKEVEAIRSKLVANLK